MILNNYTQDDIKNNFMQLKNVKTGQLLRVVRDTMLGFTMCPVEGKYTPDTLCGIDCDDQPFVDGLNNDTTFFARDDCEGRLQQGQTVLNCIIAFLAYTDHDIFDHIRSENHSILAQLSDPLLLASIQCVQTIAWLFRENIIEFKMVVGEATFASYPRKPNQPIKYTGHSFGALVCLPQNKRHTFDLPWLMNNPTQATLQVFLSPALQIVEATGWMDEFTQSAEKNATKRVTEYFATHPQHQTPNMRSCTTSEQVDDLYSSIYTLGQHLIFGFNHKEDKWQYGASPSQILKQEALMLTPMELLNDLYTSVQQHKSANPIVKQAFANNVKMSLLTPHTIKNITQANLSIESTLTDILPYIHPPPNSKEDQKQRLDKWQPLRDAHIPQCPSTKLTAFTLPKNAPPPKTPPGFKLHSHPFMYSTVYML
eukprot:561911-Rhodomonas_salina.7